MSWQNIRRACLRPIVFAVLLATVIQGVTSFSLTQLLSKAAQRLIAELRQQVQAHVSRLPVTYYDANKTGALVSRIMSDVEGVRNLLGTGLVDFVGGIVAAAIALVLLLRISVPLTLMAVGSLACFRVCFEQGVFDDSPDFSRARQDQRGGHGTADRVSRRCTCDQGLSRRSSARRMCLRPECADCSTT